MSLEILSDGKIVMNYEGISYLCECNRHVECGGFCECKCHEVNK